jgi:hypothetical protein
VRPGRSIIPHVLYVLALLLIAYIAHAVWNGSWYGTWCASGRKPGQRLPGVHRD